MLNTPTEPKPNPLLAAPPSPESRQAHADWLEVMSMHPPLPEAQVDLYEALYHLCALQDRGVIDKHFTGLGGHVVSSGEQSWLLETTSELLAFVMGAQVVLNAVGAQEL